IHQQVTHTKTPLSFFRQSGITKEMRISYRHRLSATLTIQAQIPDAAHNPVARGDWLFAP
ncbi:MAG: hypothetical protein KJ704_01035, partial [Proteobacteria bacterium]|nr:hypothetical protein [Pseudomonadota bacterium]